MGSGGGLFSGSAAPANMMPLVTVIAIGWENWHAPVLPAAGAASPVHGIQVDESRPIRAPTPMTNGRIRGESALSHALDADCSAAFVGPPPADLLDERGLMGPRNHGRNSYRFSRTRRWITNATGIVWSPSVGSASHLEPGAPGACDPGAAAVLFRRQSCYSFAERSGRHGRGAGGRVNTGRGRGSGPSRGGLFAIVSGCPCSLARPLSDVSIAVHQGAVRDRARPVIAAASYGLGQGAPDQR